MNVDPWTAFASSLGTVGPVGLAGLAAWYLWLRYGQGTRIVPDVPINPIRLAEWHTENRDAIRDTNKTVSEIAKLQDRELDHLNNLVNAQVRVAEILERIETNQRSGRRG